MHTQRLKLLLTAMAVAGSLGAQTSKPVRVPDTYKPSNNPMYH